MRGAFEAARPGAAPGKDRGLLGMEAASAGPIPVRARPASGQSAPRRAAPAVATVIYRQGVRADAGP